MKKNINHKLLKIYSFCNEIANYLFATSSKLIECYDFKNRTLVLLSERILREGIDTANRFIDTLDSFSILFIKQQLPSNYKRIYYLYRCKLHQITKLYEKMLNIVNQQQEVYQAQTNIYIVLLDEIKIISNLLYKNKQLNIIVTELNNLIKRDKKRIQNIIVCVLLSVILSTLFSFTFISTS